MLGELQQHLFPLDVLLLTTPQQGTPHGESSLRFSCFTLQTVQGGGSGPEHGQGPGKTLALCRSRLPGAAGCFQPVHRARPAPTPTRQMVCPLMPPFRGWLQGHGGRKGCGVGRMQLQQLLTPARDLLPGSCAHGCLWKAAQQLLPEDVCLSVIPPALLALGGKGQGNGGQGIVSPTLPSQGRTAFGHQQGRFTPAQRIHRPSIGLPQLDRCRLGGQRWLSFPQQALAHDGDRQAQSGRCEQKGEEVPGSCGHAVAGTHHILRSAEGGRSPVTWDAKRSAHGL